MDHGRTMYGQTQPRCGGVLGSQVGGAPPNPRRLSDKNAPANLVQDPYQNVGIQDGNDTKRAQQRR